MDGLDSPEADVLRAVASLLVIAVERHNPGTIPPDMLAAYCDYGPSAPPLHADVNLN